MQKDKIFSVSDITRQIKSALEIGFPNILVQGEISNVKLHSSGHLYFTLKDEGSQISAVMWKNRVSQMLFRPTDGMKIIARGNISVYEPRGTYQLDCFLLQPIGKGELQNAFEKLKSRLFEEGLFDQEHKKPIPEYPSRIGIITSPTGAALHDIVSVLSRRMPSIEVFFVPVKVQGVGAAEEIASAINILNEQKNIDVMIVGRGGGSLEDLWAFNEEIVARSIFFSKIPIISAVGHEIDFTISDFVADFRAPTPSAAAEIAVKDKNELIELIGNICYTMSNAMTYLINSKRQTVEHLALNYTFNRPLDIVKQKSQHVDELNRRLEQGINFNIRTVKHKYDLFSSRIYALNPKHILKRGYAIVSQNGRSRPTAASLENNQNAEIEFYDGNAFVTINGKEILTNGKKRK